MNAIANTLVALVAALHVYFLTLEMFFWTKPLGLRVFGNTLEKATDSAVLAANQGLYNGFLAAGLIWGLLQPSAAFAFQIKVFFLAGRGPNGPEKIADRSARPAPAPSGRHLDRRIEFGRQRAHVRRLPHPRLMVGLGARQQGLVADHIQRGAGHDLRHVH